MSEGGRLQKPCWVEAHLRGILFREFAEGFVLGIHNVNGD